MTTWPVAKPAPVAGAWRVGGGWRIIFTETVFPRQVAPRTTGVVAVTCRVATEKEPNWPVAVTLAGPDAAGELLASAAAPRGSRAWAGTVHPAMQWGLSAGRDQHLVAEGCPDPQPGLVQPALEGGLADAGDLGGLLRG
jgi:hypothetical protein